LPDPHTAQLSDLLDRLVAARAGFIAQDTQAACDAVGATQTRLFGEPGLTSIQPTWSSLRDAAEALQAVCGQATMLRQATSPSPASEAARQRWQAGIQRELGVACQYLKGAAQALGRGASPC
jgi:hypothetical protein